MINFPSTVSSTLSSVNLLHPPRVLDQVIPTRRLIAQAIARQYFGCYLLPQSWWVWSQKRASWLCGYLYQFEIKSIHSQLTAKSVHTVPEFTFVCHSHYRSLLPHTSTPTNPSLPHIFHSSTPTRPTLPHTFHTLHPLTPPLVHTLQTYVLTPSLRPGVIGG